MAIGAPYVAFIDFGADFVDAATVGNHSAYRILLFCWIAVVKFKHSDVIFTAVNARVLKEVGPYPHPRSHFGVVILRTLNRHP